MRYGDACQEKAKLILPDDSKAIANMIQEANSVLDVSTIQNQILNDIYDIHIKSLNTIMLTSRAPYPLLFPCKESAGWSTYLCPCPLTNLSGDKLSQYKNFEAQFKRFLKFLSAAFEPNHGRQH